MSLTINLEIGHDASLRTKTTPEGFTHDWEVFVRGCNGAEIHYYVEKVVFHLHVTFAKPKRVVKEPPYSLKTSGYAGFNLPIDIYLRNNQEPKRIRFNYDLELQPTGPPIHRLQKEKYVFHNPSDEFRSKLVKGGAVVGGTGNSQENSAKSEEKAQMTSKPKLSGSDITKKYKVRPEEQRPDDAFTNLFGTPITKTSRPEHPPPKHKETPKSSTSKTEKVVEKEKPKTKSPYKDKDRDKDKPKEKSESTDKKLKEDKKDKKDKKDKERSKDKKDRKDREREKSPPVRAKSPSPKRSPKITRSPSPPKTSSSKDKEASKDKESKDKREDKKSKKDKYKEHKENKYKDKEKERDRDRSSGDVKDYKNRDSSKGKDSMVLPKEEEASPNNSTPSVTSHQSQYSQKTEKKEKIKEKDQVVKDPPKEIEVKQEKIKTEKTEDKPKHKHKKRDKDRKEKKEEKPPKQEKKSEKTVVSSSVKEAVKETPTVTSSKEKNVDRSNLFGSPKSDPPSTPVESKRSHSLTGLVDDDTSTSSKTSSREPSPTPPPLQVPPTPPPVIEAPPLKNAEPEPPAKKNKEEFKQQKKDKKEKKKDKKSDREKRKWKSDAQTQAEADEPPEKLTRESDNLNNNSDDERKVSSTEDANLPAVNDDAEAYMNMLRDLQHKIMGLKNNSDLQKVVQLIAETGRYEVSANTFDFDLCLLDRSTVRQLQDFFTTVPTT